jgi:hypothetical protein
LPIWKAVNSFKLLFVCSFKIAINIHSIITSLNRPCKLKRDVQGDKLYSLSEL